MPNDAPPDKPNRIHVSQLESVPAISAIGLIAAKALQANHTVTLQVSTDGFIEFVPAGELQLDARSEESALQELISRGYTDKQLEDYLRQRQIRQPDGAMTLAQDDHR